MKNLWQRRRRRRRWRNGFSLRLGFIFKWNWRGLCQNIFIFKGNNCALLFFIYVISHISDPFLMTFWLCICKIRTYPFHKTKGWQIYHKLLSNFLGMCKKVLKCCARTDMICHFKDKWPAIHLQLVLGCWVVPQCFKAILVFLFYLKLEGTIITLDTNI